MSLRGKYGRFADVCACCVGETIPITKWLRIHSTASCSCSSATPPNTQDNHPKNQIGNLLQFCRCSQINSPNAIMSVWKCCFGSLLRHFPHIPWLLLWCFCNTTPCYFLLISNVNIIVIIRHWRNHVNLSPLRLTKFLLSGWAEHRASSRPSGVQWQSSGCHVVVVVLFSCCCSNFSAKESWPMIFLL